VGTNPTDRSPANITESVFAVEYADGNGGRSSVTTLTGLASDTMVEMAVDDGGGHILLSTVVQIPLEGVAVTKIVNHLPKCMCVPEERSRIRLRSHCFLQGVLDFRHRSVTGCVAPTAG
jgi:hypothetical protein